MTPATLTRLSRHQRVISVTSTTAVIECLTCSHRQTVPRDEDGSAELDQGPCAHDECTKRLCSACPQFICDDCDFTHCLEHRIEYSGLELCPLCLAGRVADGVMECPG